jgi:hypothetical protein
MNKQREQLDIWFNPDTGFWEVSHYDLDIVIADHIKDKETAKKVLELYREQEFISPVFETVTYHEPATALALP